MTGEPLPQCRLCRGPLATHAARTIGVCNWCILASQEAPRGLVIRTPSYRAEMVEEPAASTDVIVGGP